MGKSSNTKVLLILAVLILGVYVLPSAVAKYAGSHTWERNATNGVTGLKCGKCHTYIRDEINYSGAIGNVKGSHMNASNFSFYVGPNGTIDINTTPTGSLDDVCWMCHVQESDATIGGGHTKVVIRVCTDVDCHGDYNQLGTSAAFYWGNNRSNVTGMLGQTADAHGNFYNPLNGSLSDVINEDTGTPYSQGYLACLACHTYVGMDIEFTRPNKLSLNMTYSSSSNWTLNSMTVNDSSVNVSIGGKSPGSVWS